MFIYNLIHIVCEFYEFVKRPFILILLSKHWVLNLKTRQRELIAKVIETEGDGLGYSMVFTNAVML